MTDKLRLDLPLILPDVPDAADACVNRLIDDLTARPGIETAHIRPAEGNAVAQLCVHYDPEVLPLSRIRELVQAAGAQITRRIGHLLLQTADISHQRRARTVSDLLAAQTGVLQAEASITGQINIEFDREHTSGSTLIEALAKMGVRATRTMSAPQPTGDPEAEHMHSDSDAHTHRDSSHAHSHDSPDAHSQGAAVCQEHGHGNADAHGNAHHEGHSGHRHGNEDHHGHAHEDGNKHKHGGCHGHEHGHKHGGGHGHGGGHNHAHGGFLGPNTELIFSLTCGGLLAIGFLLEKLTPASGWLPLACYIAAYFFGGFYTVREALDNLHLKRFEIDTLMLVAAGGAAVLGAWGEGALLLFLFSLGHALEHYAMGRAKKAIEALAELAPETATVRRQGALQEIPVAQLRVGDIVIVRPNERLAADGFITEGTSSINQAPVTGESIPVDKNPVADSAAARARPDAVDAASRVFAGTINGGGALEVEVTRRSADSALARVIQMVSEAETRKSPTQRFTDKFERIFVPAVLTLAFVLLFAFLVVDEPFSASFYRAMAVLVAASPCALAIATPSAVLSGIARSARGGVLIKGGAPLEELGSLSAIAFDKTGTLTEGKPRITDIVPAEGVSEAELLAVTVAVEALSDHPLALAITRDGKERLGSAQLPLAKDLHSLTGRGVTAQLDGQSAWIGKAEMFGTDGIPPLGADVLAATGQLREQGRTTMVVRLGTRDLGVIGLMDTPRAEAADALRQLRQLGITRMTMISGDNARVAQAVAQQVGLDEAWGDLMPEDKVEAIRKLKEQSKVAMVGDGVNDAPAMANASVGIAMGAAGSDVALETADIALMADNLRNLPFAVGLSRHTRKIILQNVFISLGVIAFLVPLTILGLGLGPAVAVHEGSTLVVVFNALRLLAYRNPNP